MHVPEISQKLLRLLTWQTSADRRPSPDKVPDEPPLRAELFSIDQLERHAKSVATSHSLALGRASDRLLPRLDENQQVLVATYDLVTAAAEQNRRIEPAAEWLLDNFYLVEEQIRSIRRLLPPSYSRELPRLASGAASGFPRVYGIALELIAHVDGRVDAASLNGFIASYQAVEPLKLGELWALPLMLRLALIENLRRVAVRIASARRDRDAGGKLGRAHGHGGGAKTNRPDFGARRHGARRPAVVRRLSLGTDSSFAGPEPKLRVRQQLARTPPC